jgi:hypothetical protein
MTNQTNKDERATPQGGLPTPPGVKIERKEGRVAAANESVGGEIETNLHKGNQQK